MENKEIEMKKEISENDQSVCDNVVISIDRALEGLPKVNANCNIIYQVSKDLLEMKPVAYVPQLISIGPLHHSTRNDLIANEHYKLQGFYSFLRRINNNNITDQSLLLKELVEKSHGWVKESRNCYATPINMGDEEFLMIMLVDACFILEFLILRYTYGSTPVQDNGTLDFSFYQGVFYEILVDLIKLENQVPFFLLQNLYDLIPNDNLPSFPTGREENEYYLVSLKNLTNIAVKSFGFLRKYELKDDLYNKEPKHLLDLLSFYFVPIVDVDVDDMQNKQECVNNNRNLSSFFGVSALCCVWNKKRDDQEEKRQKWRLSPPSVTELHDPGVIIKATENYENSCCTTISFENGVLEIPCVVIETTFEVMVRNLIAFDNYPAGNKNMYAIQYMLFLDDLINTEGDVRLLVEAGVITNTLGGSDKEISELFNNISKFATFPIISQYDAISKALRVHCNGRWNKAKATLKHDYFNTPWAAISFVAATFLLLLTVVQTVFSAITTFPS